MSALDELKVRGHEEVVFFRDRQSGIISIIAIHDTTLGPALGGCRMRDYSSLEEALVDVLRLAEGMTYKNSLAGLNLGGGKSVIIAPRNLQDGREDLFLNFGKWVNSLGGRHITAEDMGTSVADMNVVLKTCKYVTGRDPAIGGGGDPSPWTARGVFAGMRACLERVFNSSDFKGRTVAMQGVGNVGFHLASLLHQAGAKLICADTREEMLKRVKSSFDAEIIGAEEILGVECDIFSPCAIGAIINVESVNRLRCKIIAGGANNQISGYGVEEELRRKGITYAPDFAINAGGVILCYDELEPGGFNADRVASRVDRIYNTVGLILDQSKQQNELAGAVAVSIAKKRITEAAKSI